MAQTSKGSLLQMSMWSQLPSTKNDYSILDSIENMRVSRDFLAPRVPRSHYSKMTSWRRQSTRSTVRTRASMLIWRERRLVGMRRSPYWVGESWVLHAMHWLRCAGFVFFQNISICDLEHQPCLLYPTDHHTQNGVCKPCLPKITNERILYPGIPYSLTSLHD